MPLPAGQASDLLKRLRVRMIEISGAIGADDEHSAVVGLIRCSKQRGRVTGARPAHVSRYRSEGAGRGIVELRRVRVIAASCNQHPAVDEEGGGVPAAHDRGATGI